MIISSLSNDDHFSVIRSKKTEKAKSPSFFLGYVQLLQKPIILGMITRGMSAEQLDLTSPIIQDALRRLSCGHDPIFISYTIGLSLDIVWLLRREHVVEGRPCDARLLRVRNLIRDYFENSGTDLARSQELRITVCSDYRRA
jgi:hypothetical protein